MCFIIEVFICSAGRESWLRGGVCVWWGGRAGLGWVGAGGAGQAVLFCWLEA